MRVSPKMSMNQKNLAASAAKPTIQYTMHESEGGGQGSGWGARG